MGLKKIIGVTVLGIATLYLTGCSRTSPEPPYRPIICIENALLKGLTYYCEDSRTNPVETYTDFGSGGKLDLISTQEKGQDRKEYTWIYDPNSVREDMSPEYRNKMFQRGSEDANKLQKKFDAVKIAFAEQEAEIAKRPQ